MANFLARSLMKSPPPPPPPPPPLILLRLVLLLLPDTPPLDSSFYNNSFKPHFHLWIRKMIFSLSFFFSMKKKLEDSSKYTCSLLNKYCSFF